MNSPRCARLGNLTVSREVRGELAILGVMLLLAQVLGVMKY